MCALVGDPGRKFTQYVPVEFHGKSCLIRKKRMLNSEMRYAKPLKKGNKDYPVARLCNHLLRMGKNGRMTKGARKFVQEAKAA